MSGGSAADRLLALFLNTWGSCSLETLGCWGGCRSLQLLVTRLSKGVASRGERCLPGELTGDWTRELLARWIHGAYSQLARLLVTEESTQYVRKADYQPWFLSDHALLLMGFGRCTRRPTIPLW
ncbi:hypothetical protein NDU88_004914 [Pleurodeles waltl]|uniref:Uncharacterized protein n=1 Tax=Pleurodeles waltl TaxID=8319 RepID=A0AAV7NKU1_PLEWA|nr:hypothetical protein NDU88_004914 [Pleurodeles waltl]